MKTDFVRIKICCISSIEEAKLAARYGVSALGLVSEMPSGPGVIDENLIAQITDAVPPGISTFLLTSKTDTQEIIEQQKRLKPNTIQIVDRIESGNYQDFREELPGIKIVQVVHVNGRESIEEAVSISKQVDAILLDSGNQNLEVKELGGTGRIHDWSVSKEIVKKCGVPVFLAGGLNPENVENAIKEVKPFGVDICSGVRTNGKLDERKLSRFVQNVSGI